MAQTIQQPNQGGTGIDNGLRSLTISGNSGTLNFSAASKILTIAQNLTLNGTSGKSLILTNGLTVSGNDGTISFTNASTTLTVAANASVSGTNTGDAPYVAGSGLTLTGNSFSVSNVTFAMMDTGAWSDDVTLALSSSTLFATQHAIKTYVDNQITGLSFKIQCVVATTANITLSGTQTIDGIAVVVGDRVLVKNQTTQAQNGVYIVASGSWTRATDSDTSPELIGATYPVTKGTTQQDTWWTVVNTTTITVGTTAVTFTQTGGSGTYTAGSGLTLTANSFSISSGAVTNAMLAGSIAYSKLALTGAILNADLAGSIDLATKVTGTLPAVNGGSGQNTYAKGDLLASPGSNTLNKLAVGSDGQVLTADAASTNGVKWAAAASGGPLVAYLSSDLVITSNNTLTNTGLSVTVAAGGVYQVELCLEFASNSSGGMWIDCNGGSATATQFFGEWITGSTSLNSLTLISALSTYYISTLTTTFQLLFMKATLIVNAGGTFIVRMAQPVSSANSTTIYKGANIRLTKLN